MLQWFLRFAFKQMESWEDKTVCVFVFWMSPSGFNLHLLFHPSFNETTKHTNRRVLSLNFTQGKQSSSSSLSDVAKARQLSAASSSLIPPPYFMRRHSWGSYGMQRGRCNNFIAFVTFILTHGEVAALRGLRKSASLVCKFLPPYLWHYYVKVYLPRREGGVV